MDETGASLYDESTMTLTKTDPFDVFILSSGRNEFYTYDPGDAWPGSKVIAHKEANGTTSETLYYGTDHLGTVF